MRRSLPKGSAKTCLSFLGADFIIDYDYKVTYAGCPERGPSYSSGGEPAEGPEFDIKITGLHPDDGTLDAPPLEVPSWLNELLEIALIGSDDVWEAIREAEPDPDAERDRWRDDRNE